MEAPNFKSWKTAFLLSIIIPISLIVAFKQEPLTISEVMNLPPQEWTFLRPSPGNDMAICQWLNATHDDPKIHFSINLEIGQFDTGRMTWIPPGDSIRFVLFIDASVDYGSSLQSIEIVFRNDTQPSYVWIQETSLELSNLTLVYFRKIYDVQESNKTHLILVGDSNPNKVKFKAIGEWFLYDVSPNAGNHRLEAAFELTYYNGTAYKKITQSFQLTEYSGYHYLKIGAFVLGYEANVTVLVDGTEHHTPFNLVISEGLHRIEFQPSIQIDSTIYSFCYFSGISPDSGVSNREHDVTLNITEDTQIYADYTTSFD